MENTIKHITVKGHHALYKDGERIASWHGNRKSVQDTLDFLSGLEIDFSKYGVIEEYAGRAVLEKYLEPNNTWPKSYEELDETREMGLYKNKK